MSNTIRLLTLASILVLISQLWNGVLAQSTPPSSPTITGELTFAAVGDSVIMTPISVHEREPAFAEVVKLIRDADVAFTNLEMSFLENPKSPPPLQEENGGLGAHASRVEAKDLKWLGFDMVSRANNHTTDYGVEGMFQTNRIVEEVGMIHAGSGASLGEARAPAYFQTPVGRIAMIATASTHSPMSRASHPRQESKGRPGLSPLRWTRNVFLDPVAFASLKNAVASMNLVQAPAPFTDEQMNLFGTSFKKSDTNRVELVADERDVQEILAQVKSARRQADFVFVTIHAHEPSNPSEIPADFLPKFARAAVDAGADMFIGHGPHQLRGIEIYKGRPIFYSLGSFISHTHLIDQQGIQMYERPNLDIFRSTIGDLYDQLQGTQFNEEFYWDSMVAIVKFDNDKLMSVELHPVDLGFRLPRSQRGNPRIASATMSKKIIDRLARISAPFGTKILFENGIGIVQLRSSSNGRY